MSRAVVMQKRRRVPVVAAAMGVLLYGSTTMAITFDPELQQAARALTGNAGQKELIGCFNAMGASPQVTQLLDALVRAYQHARSISELELFGGRKHIDADVCRSVLDDKKWVKNVIEIYGAPPELGRITVRKQKTKPRHFTQGIYRRAMIPLQIGDARLELIADYLSAARPGRGARLHIGLKVKSRSLGVWGYRMGGQIVERLTTVKGKRR